MSTHKKKRSHGESKNRDFPIRMDGQVYARVTKMSGSCRLLATCTYGCERTCTIRGSMRKREWVHEGDTVLLALREFADERADVVFCYNDTEVRRLRSMGEEVTAYAAEDSDEEGGVHFDHDVDVDTI